MAAKDEMMSRLVLGTAQIGMPYGIANKSGKPDFSSSVSIVQAAWESGITEFDTAQAYGESEQILGDALAKLGISHQARVITKIAPRIDIENEVAVRQAVENSIENLNVPNLYGLMLHREEVLNLSHQKLKSIVRNLACDGSIMHVGISVYTPAKGLQALDSGLFDMLQVPASILDRRFYEAGIFTLAKRRNIKIYIRSIFLQGLILLERIPVEMEFVRPILASFRRLSEEIGKSCREVALMYVKSRYPEAMVVFGAEKFQQVRDNVQAWSGTLSTSWLGRLEEEFSHVDEIIVNPTLWPKCQQRGRM